MDNELPTCMYFEVNEMGNKEFSWSGLRIDHPELQVGGETTEVDFSLCLLWYMFLTKHTIHC